MHSLHTFGALRWCTPSGAFGAAEKEDDGCDKGGVEGGNEGLLEERREINGELNSYIGSLFKKNALSRRGRAQRRTMRAECGGLESLVRFSGSTLRRSDARSRRESTSSSAARYR